ncbi:unnamed protein product [Urochloa humidicola]
MAPTIANPLLTDLVAQMGQVPSSDVRPVGDRPDLFNVDNESGAGIPLIELKKLNGPERHEVVEAIGRAYESDGFFMVTNHGIPAWVVEGMLRVAREFFHLPESERLKCYSDDPKKAIGLSTSFNVCTEKVSNWREFLRLHCYPLESFVDQWPSNPSSFRQVVGTYTTEARALALRLLEAISESLGLERSHMVAAMGRQAQHMAVNYYPQCPQPGLTYGLPGHKDPNANAITLLLQDGVSGLQVQRGGRWVDVNPVPDALVINIGDQLQALSNVRYNGVNWYSDEPKKAICLSTSFDVRTENEKAAAAASKLVLPPGFCFMPTDEEVVEHYLLPRIRGQPLPAGDILEDDPLSAQPWLLLGKHGRKGDAFFFAAGQAMNGKGSRQKRSCAGGGTWQGQGTRKNARGGEDERRPRVRVGGEEIEWQKYALNFHEDGVKGSTGWVMHEYSITSPPGFAASPLRVYRIRFSGHGRNAQKRKRNELDWGRDEQEEEEVYAGEARAATRPKMAEPDALFVSGCPLPPPLEFASSLPIVGLDVGDGSLAGFGWAEDGAGSALPASADDQDLPAVVDCGNEWNFNDLLLDYDFQGAVTDA